MSPAPTRLMRAPSVDDYQRMTQAARLSAARLVEEQLHAIAERRAQYQPPTPRRDMTPAETVEVAKFLARRYDTEHPEHPYIKASRLAACVAEAAEHRDPRTREKAS